MAQAQKQQQEQQQKPEAEKSRTIAICVDGSQQCNQAIAFYASRLARPTDRVQLFSVVDPPSMSPTSAAAASGATADRFEDAWQRRLQQAAELEARARLTLRQLLSDSGRSLDGGAGAVEFHQRVSADVGATLCQMAKSVRPAALIVGSRGHGTMRRTVLGSVSDYVLHHCRSTTVLIVPAGRRRNSGSQ